MTIKTNTLTLHNCLQTSRLYLNNNKNFSLVSKYLPLFLQGFLLLQKKKIMKNLQSFVKKIKLPLTLKCIESFLGKKIIFIQTVVDIVNQSFLFQRIKTNTVPSLPINSRNFQYFSGTLPSWTLPGRSAGNFFYVISGAKRRENVFNSIPGAECW